MCPSHTICCLFLILCAFVLHVKSASTSHRQTIERVREYLRQHDKDEELATSQVRQLDWLENSNKIGFGYNVLSGTPVCYTAACQMMGFTRAIFKLNYAAPSIGSCTSQLVPDNVELDCLPSASLTADSETISTIEQLKKSITDKIDIAAGSSFSAAAFSYAYSKETRYMIDNIVKHDRTSILTRAQVSFAKLSLFEDYMDPSDKFRYVIENMPYSGGNDPGIDEYIEEFIFNYFGFTYITSILLGGIAQENILIDRKTHERMKSQGIDTEQQAQISFKLKFGASASTTLTSNETTVAHNAFTSQLHSTHATTLGGSAHLTTLPEWSKTVPSNPVVIQLTVRDIFRLLVPYNFPNDPLIATKSLLIKQSLDKYLNKIPTYCYNDCGGKSGNQGTCIPRENFQMGECRCKPQWTGVDCTVPVIKHQILHGTICGFDRSFIRANCGGLRPYTQGCPAGWKAKNWKTDLTVCFKDGTAEAKPMFGTLCGLYATYDRSQGSSDIPCNLNSLTDGQNPSGCPSSYQKVTAVNNGNSDRNTICLSQNANEDLPGTICGMQIEGTKDGPDCEGQNPGLRQCPAKYYIYRTVFNSLGFLVCVKQ